MAKRMAFFMLALLLAAFFAFVGWNKAFASLADLAKYGSWTVHLPETLGRIIGWSEIGCAIAFLITRSRFSAALLLIVNQCAAAIFHFINNETGALPQNAVLIVILASIAFAIPPQPVQRRPDVFRRRWQTGDDAET